MWGLRHGAAAAALLVLGCGLTPAQDNPRAFRQAASSCKKGTDALQDGNLDEARTHFQQALELVPGLAEAHVGLGHIAMRASRWDAALDEYLKAKDGYLALTQRVNAREFERYFNAQLQADLLRDSIREIKTNPQSKLGEEQRERTAAPQESEVEHAERMGHPGRGEPPKVPAELWFLVGNAQFRLGRFDEAQASWEECVRSSPEFPPVYNNLALVYFKQARYADAQFNLTRAAELGVPVNPKFRQMIEDALARVQVAPPPS